MNKNYVILDEQEIKTYINSVIRAARQSTCQRSKCGSIIISENGELLGIGWNSQPCDDTKKCFKSDKTCCVHAEQRAIIDALKVNSDEVFGSTLFFIRLDDKGNPKKSGDPYCTICSKLALDVGIKEFVLWREEGWIAYNTEYYNKLSFEYGK